MTTSVSVNDVRVPERHRSLDPHTVKGLVDSFIQMGQKTPIDFYWDGNTPVLIAGRHRLEAARTLDWPTIDAVEMEADPFRRSLWEIDENLIRAELTEIERGEHLNRRKEIFEARRSAEKIPTSRVNKGFDQDTADKTGLDKSTVRKSRKRAEKITPEVKDTIKDMPAADKGVELDAIAGLDAEEQMQAVERVKSGASKNFREAKEFIRGTGLTAGEEIERDHRARIHLSNLFSHIGKIVYLAETINSDKTVAYAAENLLAHITKFEQQERYSIQKLIASCAVVEHHLPLFRKLIEEKTE